MVDQKQMSEGAEAPVKSKTVGEQGHVLPIGVAGPTGALGKDLVLRKWTFKEERELGKLRSEHQSATLPEYVGMVISTVVSRAGAVDFSKLEMPARRAVVSQMYMADVYYAYIQARIHAIGPDLSLDLTCRHCRKEVKYVGDLNTAEVKTLPDPLAGQWDIDLKDPIQLRGKEVKSFRCGQMRWTALEQGGHEVGPGDSGGTKLMVILGTVIGITGESGDIVLMEQELDALSKRDIERICHSIDQHSVGPDLSLKLKCPHKRCGKDSVVAIDWSYDSFFSVSST